MTNTFSQLDMTGKNSEKNDRLTQLCSPQHSKLITKVINPEMNLSSGYLNNIDPINKPIKIIQQMIIIIVTQMLRRQKTTLRK